MAQAYAGSNVRVLVGSADAVWDFRGYVTGGSYATNPQFEPFYGGGKRVNDQPYVGYLSDFTMESLRKSTQSDALATRVTSGGELWEAFVFGNDSTPATGSDNLALFSSRRFMSAAFTSEFRSIVGADISSEAGRSGTVYRGDAELVSLQAAGAISGIATEGGAGVRALFLCTEDPVTSSGDVELAIGGQTLTITGEGAYFTDADLAAGALTPAVTVTSSGTLTSLEGWLLVGQGMV